MHTESGDILQHRYITDLAKHSIFTLCPFKEHQVGKNSGELQNGGPDNHISASVGETQAIKGVAKGMCMCLGITFAASKRNRHAGLEIFLRNNKYTFQNAISQSDSSCTSEKSMRVVVMHSA